MPASIMIIIVFERKTEISVLRFGYGYLPCQHHNTQWQKLRRKNEIPTTYYLLTTYHLTSYLTASSYYLLTTYLHARESLKSHNSTSSQEIPRILDNSMIHYRIHNNPPLVPVLSQINPVYALLSAFLKVHIKIILPLTHMSSKWSTSLRFPHESRYTPQSFCVSHAPPITCILITRIILGGEHDILMD